MNCLQLRYAVVLALVIGAVVHGHAHQHESARERNDQLLLLQQENPIAAFDDWMAQFDRSYVKGSAEWRERYEIWVTNLYHAIQYNSEQRTHWLTMTGLADMKQVEVKENLLGFMKPFSKRSSPSSRNATALEDDVLSDVPRRVDWRERGAVTRVKDQRRCGACWAFSAVGSIEGLNAISTGKLVTFSEQELIDCDNFDRGCTGGYMETAFSWVKENGGITTSQDYDYSAVTHKCNRKKVDHHHFSISGFEKVEVGETHLIRALAHQPVSVAVQADILAFSLYGGGIFDAPCGIDLDHAAVAVGYDLDEGYLIVKNSWGHLWGEDGFIRLAMNRNKGNGQCGVAVMASYPVAKASTPVPQPQPAEPTVQKCGFQSYCAEEETCCCTHQVWKMCFQWGCCPGGSSTCCSDMQFCCPHHHPVCGPSLGVCTNGKSQVPAMNKGLTLVMPSRREWHSSRKMFPPSI